MSSWISLPHWFRQCCCMHKWLILTPRTGKLHYLPSWVRVPTNNIPIDEQMPPWNIFNRRSKSVHSLPCRLWVRTDCQIQLLGRNDILERWWILHISNSSWAFSIDWCKRNCHISSMPCWLLQVIRNANVRNLSHRSLLQLRNYHASRMPSWDLTRFRR